MSSFVRRASIAFLHFIIYWLLLRIDLGRLARCLLRLTLFCVDVDAEI